MGKRIVVVVLALCLAVCSCVCLAGCSKENDKPSYQLVQEGTLTVALSPNFPPFDMSLSLQMTTRLPARLPPALVWD